MLLNDGLLYNACFTSSFLDSQKVCLTFYNYVAILPISANDYEQTGQQKLGAQKVIIELFFRQGCKECAKVKAIVLPKVARELPGSYELRQYDLGEGDNYIKLSFKITCEFYKQPCR